MVLNVVGGQEWSGFCRFGRQKNAIERGCTRNRADGGIKVVKCGGMREEMLVGVASSRVGFHALTKHQCPEFKVLCIF